jgi:hypothetical protein
MTRRRHLPLLLAALLAAAPAAVAQDAANRAEGRGGPAADTPTRPAASRPRKPRRRATQPREPAASAQQQQPAAPAPETGPRLEAAPVPNRELEAPRGGAGTPNDRTRLTPSVITRPLPNQGMAAEGAASIQEERLFFPAPGARLNVPFSY